MSQYYVPFQSVSFCRISIIPYVHTNLQYRISVAYLLLNLNQATEFRWRFSYTRVIAQSEIGHIFPDHSQNKDDDDAKCTMIEICPNISRFTGIIQIILDP